MDELLKALAPFNYVVQRNWQDLPDLDPDHPDLDLFVAEEDYNDCLLVTQEYGFIDLRHPSDGYYPPYISQLMLIDRREHNGWAIPNKKAYFLSLYYHDAVHKKDNPYKTELRRAFLDWINPTEPDDKGVNYYGDY